MKRKHVLLSFFLGVVLALSLCIFAGCKNEGAEYFSGTWKVVYMQDNDGKALCDDSFITVKNDKFQFTSKSEKSFESDMDYLGSSGTTSDDGVNFDFGFSFNLTDEKLHCGAHVVSDGALRLKAWKMNDDDSYNASASPLWVWYLVRCEDTTASFKDFNIARLNGAWNVYVAAGYSILDLNYSAEKWNVTAESVQVEKTLNNGAKEISGFKYTWAANAGFHYAKTGSDKESVYGFICVNADNEYNKIYVINIRDLELRYDLNRIKWEYSNFVVLTRAN
ncbi:MAG: hypothetical protein K2L02_06015 [Clostridia bacterium]|nr:hypothetical protein [Clostridia bacterium]